MRPIGMVATSLSIDSSRVIPARSARSLWIFGVMAVSTTPGQTALTCTFGARARARDFTTLATPALEAV